MARGIWIYRDAQVVNGYVQAAPNLESEKTNKTADQAIIDLETNMNSDVSPNQELILGSGRVTKHGVVKGRQSWIRLPGLEPDEWYRDKSGNSIDPMQVMR